MICCPRSGQGGLGNPGHQGLIGPGHVWIVVSNTLKLVLLLETGIDFPKEPGLTQICTVHEIYMEEVERLLWSPGGGGHHLQRTGAPCWPFVSFHFRCLSLQLLLILHT